VVKITVTDAISYNTISAAQTICANTKPATLTGTVAVTNIGQPEYLWESSTDGIHFLTAIGTNNQQSYAPGSLNRTTWFRRKASVPGCATHISNTVEITVNPAPIALVTNPGSICPGSRATLTVQGNGQRYEWFESATGTNPLHTGNSFTTPVLQTNQIYYVQAVLQGCTSSRVPVTVTVGIPKITAGEDVLIDAGKSTQLMASGGVSYQWSPAEGLSDPQAANPVANPTTTTRYTVTITTPEGCIATDEVVVSIRPGVNIPNGFTPDRDGINDTWEIANIKKYPNCQVKIFNRWGTLIYSSNGYQQPWDGTYNQQDLPVATYYYSIILNKDEKPISGSVTIIK
jgi:gliding motility-associated-like protein